MDNIQFCVQRSIQRYHRKRAQRPVRIRPRYDQIFCNFICNQTFLIIFRHFFRYKTCGGLLAAVRYVMHYRRYVVYRSSTG